VTLILLFGSCQGRRAGEIACVEEQMGVVLTVFSGSYPSNPASKGPGAGLSINASLA
jgi:hypothetical protein